jgi:Subtilase family
MRCGVYAAFAFATGVSVQAEARSGAGVDLHWNRRTAKVDAHLTNAPLERILATVARDTGWKVFVEPGGARTVSANFKSLPQAEALERLLGGLSYLLVPQDTGGSRLLVFRSSADAATESIEAAIADGEITVEPGPIRNELIVRIKPGSKVTPEEIAAKLGAKLAGRLDALGAYLLRFESPEQANAAREVLAGRDDVAAVENNVRVPPPEAGSFQNGSPGTITLRPKVSGDQKYVIAAVVDMPVQTLSTEYEQFILERRNITSGSAPADGTPTHGTVMVESLLQGVAQTDTSPDGTKVRIISENVYGSDSTTTTWQVAAGLVDAASRGATIFNLSLGGKTDSPMLADVIASIHQQGGEVFAASGNTPGKDLTFPAADPGAFGVTAIGPDGTPASYANTGPQAVLAGPGTTYVPFQGRTWMAQGTSGATATVSGLAAGLASQANLPVSQIQARLFQMTAFQQASQPQPTP